MSRLWQIVSFIYLRFCFPPNCHHSFFLYDLQLFFSSTGSFVCFKKIILRHIYLRKKSRVNSNPYTICIYRYSKKTSLFTHHKTHPEHCVHCGENRGSSVENIYEHNLKHVDLRPYAAYFHDPLTF